VLTQNIQSGGVLLSRFNPTIQFAARGYLAAHWKTDRVDAITAEDPLHLFFHDVDQEELERLSAHIETFLNGAGEQRLALVAGSRTDVLTDEEVKRKVSGATAHLSRRFPHVAVEGLFVDLKTGAVESIA
jgi:hypothetical protein